MILTNPKSYNWHYPDQATADLVAATVDFFETKGVHQLFIIGWIVWRHDHRRRIEAFDLDSEFLRSKTPGAPHIIHAAVLEPGASRFQ